MCFRCFFEGSKKTDALDPLKIMTASGLILVMEEILHHLGYIYIHIIYIKPCK